MAKSIGPLVLSSRLLIENEDPMSFSEHTMSCSRIWPVPRGGAQGEAGKKTIPLGNGSEGEIHEMRFRFVYPPKEMRKVFAASPARAVFLTAGYSAIASFCFSSNSGRATDFHLFLLDAGAPKRALRLSMIASAEVFSPPDPR
ncbi:hypothetical protein B0H17DRAFT_614308 [Mycena rosella]|uniref:Uncharacterized protein n=1 Tax=Mycena rosella TaxID=1033263 RepID=A0AAD7M8X1_MYCRO|nr:hypothetical protein B0H17DRAFT_614308 [Mycena rosella]